MTACGYITYFMGWFKLYTAATHFPKFNLCATSSYYRKNLIVSQWLWWEFSSGTYCSSLAMLSALCVLSHLILKPPCKLHFSLILPGGRWGYMELNLQSRMGLQSTSQSRDFQILPGPSLFKLCNTVSETSIEFKLNISSLRNTSI